jgi:ABC-type anion transport system duplicated permease subunit
LLLLTILTMIVVVLAMNKLLWRPLSRRASLRYRLEV